MGNQDGIREAMSAFKTNEVFDFDGGYFSFAFGNEVVLVIKDSGKSNPYWTLNVGDDVWTLIQRRFTAKSTLADIVPFWRAQSLLHEVNDWSHDFKDLPEVN